MPLLWQGLTRLFRAVLTLSLRACPVIAVVALARLALRRAPRAALCALWGAAGLRLVCPAGIPIVLPAAPETARAAGMTAWPDIPELLPPLERITAPLETVPAAAAGAPYAALPAAVWLAGMAALLGWSAASLIRLRRRLRGVAVRPWPEACASVACASGHFARTPLLVCAGLPTAFVLGLARPRIYVPGGLTERQLTCILCHECAHLRRRDHLVKPLAFLILCLHWFNPLVWLAFALFVQDMEWACDEAALRYLGGGTKRVKKEYSAALLAMARLRCAAGTSRRACHDFISVPPAFGEGAVKGRVKNVLRYKKAALGVFAVTVALLILLAVILLAEPTRAAQGGITQIVFPAYQEGRDEWNAAIYDTAPFTVGMRLPDGWQLTQPPTPGGSPWTPMDILDENGAWMGSIGFGQFEAVEDLPAAEFYKAAFSELRLGSLIRWCNEYVPVRVTETQESAVSLCYINGSYGNSPVDAGLQAADPAAAGEQAYPCVTLYDRTLGVYTALRFAPNILSDEQLLTLAETMTLEPVV